MMPAAKMGGYNFRDMMTALSLMDGDEIDKIDLAIELIFTNGLVEAAQLLREVKRDRRLAMKLHTLLQANDVEEAKLIFDNEIRPALESGKQGKDK